MDCLPDVWRKVESIADKFEAHAPMFKDLGYQELTDIRDDLNACAEAVQTIRDKIVFDK
jgi:hypothetical protein